ncbi:MAG: hypothetical protein ACJ79H_03540 [Myxococcales bacterium]
MENQHRLIAGYRELTEKEIGLINQIKQEAEVVGGIVKILEDGVRAAEDSGHQSPVDPRWVEIGRTQLQQGFMALVRAVAQPETF